MSAKSLVLTFTGADRPGIVDDLARTVTAHGGNWERSHMARFAGRFAGILQVTADATRIDELVAALRSLEADGLAVLIEHGTPRARSATRRLRLELSGHDRSGIVREVAGALASRGLDIESLETACTEAAMAGGWIFTAAAELDAPADASLEELGHTLDGIADQLGLEIDLHEVLR